MNPRLILAMSIVTMFVLSCSSLKPPPSEELRLKATLTDEYVDILNEDTTTYAIKDTARLSLPPIALHKATVVLPAGRSPGPYDSVYVQTVITKRGNVKRAWIDWSPNKYFNKSVLKAIVQWKFQPALRSGVPIDTLVKIAVPLL